MKPTGETLVRGFWGRNPLSFILHVIQYLRFFGLVLGLGDRAGLVELVEFLDGVGGFVRFGGRRAVLDIVAVGRVPGVPMQISTKSIIAQMPKPPPVNSLISPSPVYPR